MTNPVAPDTADGAAGAVRADQRAYLAEHGMYRPEFEGDACGVGLIAAVAEASAAFCASSALLWAVSALPCAVCAAACDV